MRQTHSEIVFNILKYHFPQTSESKLVKLTEKLQSDSRIKTKGSNVRNSGRRKNNANNPALCG